MHNEHIPYIGITDFMTGEQVSAMREVFTTYGGDPATRKLHVGVMMSYKTLYGIPSRWDTAFPRKEDIASIFSYTDVLNCLHYADYDGFTTADDMRHALMYGGENLHAVQFDMIWPMRELLEIVRAQDLRNIKVILQINGPALDAVGNDPERLAIRLMEYDGLISYILLDKSMGSGKTLDAAVLMPFIESLSRTCPWYGLAVAGGLGPATLDAVVPIVEQFPKVSIDAQSRLRPSGNALDPVDWDMAAEYIIKALCLFG